MAHSTVKDFLDITAQQENALKRIKDALVNAILEGLTLEEIDWTIRNTFADLTLTRRDVEIVTIE
jgi:hypothetical protein